MNGRLLTARELAEHLGVSTGALLRWTRAGKVPAVKLPSGAVRYRAGEIEAWLEARATDGPTGVLTSARALLTVHVQPDALHGQKEE